MLIYCFNTLDNVQEQLSEIKNIITSSPNKIKKNIRFTHSLSEGLYISTINDETEEF